MTAGADGGGVPVVFTVTPKQRRSWVDVVPVSPRLISGYSLLAVQRHETMLELIVNFVDDLIVSFSKGNLPSHQTLRQDI